MQKLFRRRIPSPVEEKALRWWDWLLLGVLAAGCFVLYNSHDLLLTANRSWLYLEGNPLDFYERSYAWAGNYGANYMPTTFLLFALWNIPLKLLGVSAPAGQVDHVQFWILSWYKLLPMLFLALSGVVMYRIGLVLGFSDKGAKRCMYALLASPLCLFITDIYSHYDSPTLLFMLLGLYYYFRNDSPKDMWLFCLWMGVSTTCKYHVAAIFFVLLLLREKRILRICLYAAAFAALFAVETALYWASPAFHRSVFNFSAISYVSGSDFATFLGSASFSKLAAFLVAAWAYFVRAEDHRQETAWAIYLCNGIWLALFGLSGWHPQWLMIVVPFWLLAALCHRDKTIFLLLDIAFAGVYYLVSIHMWPTLDDTAKTLGLFRFPLIVYTATSNNLFSWTSFAPSLDINTIYSVLIALMAIYFLFSHPRYLQMDSLAEQPKGQMHLLRTRLVAGLCLFLVPSLVSLHQTLHHRSGILGSPATAWADVYSAGEEGLVEQFVLQQDSNLDVIQLQLGTYGRDTEADLLLTIYDPEEDRQILSVTQSLHGVRDTAWTDFDIPDVMLTGNRVYQLRIASAESMTEENSVALGYADDANTSDRVFALMGGEPQDTSYSIHFLIKFDALSQWYHKAEPCPAEEEFWGRSMQADTKEGDQ